MNSGGTPAAESGGTASTHKRTARSANRRRHYHRQNKGNNESRPDGAKTPCRVSPQTCGGAAKSRFAGSDYADRRSFSIILNDPQALEKLRAEYVGSDQQTGSHTTATVSNAGTTSAQPSIAARSWSSSLGSDRKLLENIPRPRRHIHIQSADLFANFSPSQEYRRGIAPSRPGAFSGDDVLLVESEIVGLPQMNAEELARRFPKIFGQPIYELVASTNEGEVHVGAQSEVNTEIADASHMHTAHIQQSAFAHFTVNPGMIGHSKSMGALGSLKGSSLDGMELTRTHEVRGLPVTVGIVLSGGPAPGGHNVIAGVFDMIKWVNPESRLIGFKGGLDGLFKRDYVDIKGELMDRFRNTGGFDMIWSGRGKLTDAEKPMVTKVVAELGLQGLIIVGGDGSNSNAALLAEYLGEVCAGAEEPAADPLAAAFEEDFPKSMQTSGLVTSNHATPARPASAKNADNAAFRRIDCVVVGVPKTIDGDLKNAAVECSFGFDTAAKTYSESIGNLCTDCNVDLGVWHFVRVMGRSASHLVLECAMQTRPNLVYIGEEIQKKGIGLKQIVDEIASLVIERKRRGKPYGIVLVPEGLISFIPEVSVLIRELEVLTAGGDTQTAEAVDVERLTEGSQQVWRLLPTAIKDSLLGNRESTGYIQVAKIATERLLTRLVEDALEERGVSSKSWRHMHHYFGYEGRCAMPSNFDANYCHALGMTAASLVHHRKNGYMACVKDLHKQAVHWRPMAVPFTRLMAMIEISSSVIIPGIIRQLVDTESTWFKTFTQVRDRWKMEDYYRAPGPIQFSGPVADITNYVVNPPKVEDLLSGSHESDVVLRGEGRFKIPKRFGCYSALQRERIHKIPTLPGICKSLYIKCSRGRQLLPNDPYVHRQILVYTPRLCEDNEFHLQEVHPDMTSVPHARIKATNVGVVFLSRQSPGMQNVLWGVYERCKLNGGKCIGFKGVDGLLNCARYSKSNAENPDAGMQRDFIIITEKDLELFKNLGGTDLLGRGTDHKLLYDDQWPKIRAIVERFNLDGLVLIGSSLAMTEAAYLSEYLKRVNSPCSVVGVPATASNNLSHEFVEANIGFDTASKLYSSLIGNVLTDAASMPKYWHFVRLMGRQPSNEVLECALQTHPNIVIIGEECGVAQKTLPQLVNDIADVIQKRADGDVCRNFGAILIPDGIWLHLPTFRLMLTEIDRVINAAWRRSQRGRWRASTCSPPDTETTPPTAEGRGKTSVAGMKPRHVRQPFVGGNKGPSKEAGSAGGGAAASREALTSRESKSGGNLDAVREVKELLMNLEDNESHELLREFSPWSAAVWKSLPKYIRDEFLTEDNELRLTFVETEQLLAELVRKELAVRKAAGTYKGNFQCVTHYFGYQGRSAMPSIFDSTLGFVHGHLATMLVEQKVTGHLTNIRGLCDRVKTWKLGALPFNCLLTLVPAQQDNQLHPQLKDRQEAEMPVMPNAEINLKGKAFRWLRVARLSWEMQDRFCNPGPIQFYGPSKNFYHRILHEEQGEYSEMLRHTQQYVQKLREACTFGVDESFLKFAYTSLHGLLFLKDHPDNLLDDMANDKKRRLLNDDSVVISGTDTDEEGSDSCATS